MDQTTSTINAERPFRMPTAVWVIGAGLAAALVAVFVFNVAVTTVVSYGLFGLMMLGHLFMHGGHGAHGGHTGHATPNGADADADRNNPHAGHAGGCH